MRVSVVQMRSLAPGVSTSGGPSLRGTSALLTDVILGQASQESTQRVTGGHHVLLDPVPGIALGVLFSDPRVAAHSRMAPGRS